jgi:hypothetical protein
MQTVSVSVRVRPSPDKGPRELAAEASELLRRAAWARHVVGGSDQEASYAALGEDLVERLRAGYSCTLLAYGQTGSGKTYTMFGPSGCLTESALAEGNGAAAPAPWGVFPRVALELLRSGGGGGGGTVLHASAVEVYNNVAYDLLDDRRQLQISGGRRAEVAAVFGGAAEGACGAMGLQGKHPPGCSCRRCFKAVEEAKAAASAARRTRAAGASPSQASAPPCASPAAAEEKRPCAKGGSGRRDEGPTSSSSSSSSSSSFATVGEALWPLATPTDVARLARHVEASRAANSHRLNDRSSRSHCLVRLQVSTGGGRGGGLLVRKQFLFVDLAGSERTKKSGVEGQRLAEATQINASLTVLGRVIRGLGAEGGGGQHLPYRDSALTQLLRSSLEPGSGAAGSFTSVVVNVASEPEHAEETACSLQFGERMTAVRNVATKVAGADLGSERARLLALVRAARARVQALEAAGAGGGFTPDAPRHERLMLEESMERHRRARERCDRLRTEAAEAAGGGGGGRSAGDGRGGGRSRSHSHAGGGGGGDLTRRLAEAQAEEASIGAVLGRQLTIKRLWREPSAPFAAAQAELRELTQALSLLGAP